MTPEPKEKAIELYSKYYNRIEHTLSEEYSTNEIDVVKQCALVAIDEILNDDNEFMQTFLQKEYWIEVKEEIEKL